MPGCTIHVKMISVRYIKNIIDSVDSISRDEQVFPL